MSHYDYDDSTAFQGLSSSELIAHYKQKREAREAENPMGVTYNIAAGGCTTPSWTEPPLPKIDLKNLHRIGQMDVFIIWAITPDQPDSPWAVSVWDSESVDGNPDGYLEDLAQQEETYGARFIRVTKTSVNYDAVVASFQPSAV